MTKERTVPKRPYRDSLLLHLVLAVVIVVVSLLTGGALVRALGFAVAYFVLATGWSWWRFRQKLGRP